GALAGRGRVPGRRGQDPPHGHIGHGDQRGGEDDLDREAGAPVPVAGEVGAARRVRHVPGGGGAAAGDLGGAAGGGRDQGAAGRGPRGGGVRRVPGRGVAEDRRPDHRYGGEAAHTG